MQLPFARQSSGYDSLREFSGERLVNMYARPFPDGGVGPFILVPSPGLDDTEYSTSVVSVDDIIATPQSTAVYFVTGNTFQALPTPFSTNIEASGSDKKAILSYADTPVLAWGGDYYRFNGSTLDKPSTGAFNDVGSVTWLDGYTILGEETGARVQISALNDSASFDAVDVATAESVGDGLMRVIAHYGELWVFGTRSTEVWSNTGNADFPFQPVQGAFSPRGLLYKKCVVSTPEGLFIIGDDKVVYRLQLGAAPEKISTYFIDHVLADYTSSSDVVMFSYTYEGHRMLVIRLPDAPALVYDIGTKLWHERSSTSYTGAFQVRCATTLFGDVDYLGCDNGNVAIFSGRTDFGDSLVRHGVSLPVDSGRERFTVNELQMNFKTGATDLASDASVSVEVSWDGGNTWSTARTGNLGDATDYDQLIRFRRFGSGRTFRARFTITDPIETALYGVTLKVS